MKKIKWPMLIVALALPFAAAAIGSYFTAPAIPGWYAGLEKPFFSPPNWIFGPVWTILYLMMGFSLYLVWVKEGVKFRGSQLVFYFQLLINAAWSVLFFGLSSTAGALCLLIALWCLVVYCIIEFRKINAKAAWLLVPYILWVSFAGILNFSIWYLNR
jgi:translocator protein